MSILIYDYENALLYYARLTPADKDIPFQNKCNCYLKAFVFITYVSSSK